MLHPPGLYFGCLIVDTDIMVHNRLTISPLPLTSSFSNFEKRSGVTSRSEAISVASSPGARAGSTISEGKYSRPNVLESDVIRLVRFVNCSSFVLYNCSKVIDMLLRCSTPIVKNLAPDLIFLGICSTSHALRGERVVCVVPLNSLQWL